MDEATKAYLLAIGIPESIAAAAGPGSRLLHDFNVVGDDLFDAIKLLNEEWGVRIGSLNLTDYGPPELSWHAFVLTFFPNSGLAARIKAGYRPISVAMLECSLKSGQWSDKQDYSKTGPAI